VILLDIVCFGDYPDLETCIGAVFIIVGSSVTVFSKKQDAKE